MHAIRENYVEQLHTQLNDIIANLPIDDKNGIYQNVIGMNEEEIVNLLRKIANALPDDIVSVNYQYENQRIINQIIDELLLFLLQEDRNSKNFGYLFSEFIFNLLSDIYHKNPKLL